MLADMGTLTLFAAACFGAALLLALVPGERSAGSRRLRKRVERVRQSARLQHAQAKVQAPTSVRRQEARSVFGRASTTLVRAVPRAGVLRAALQRAGLSISVVDFTLLAFAAGAISAGAAVVFLSANLPIALGFGLIGASGIPHLFVKQRIGRRTRQFLGEFPDAIDLMVRAVKSGLPVAEAIQTAADESRNVVAEVFREVTGNLRLGLTLDESLWSAARRIQIPEFKFFVISLAIQQETGGNLSEILQNLAHMMRRRDQLKLKIKAMSSEARASAMIIGSLPFIMFGLIYIVNEKYIMKFFVDPRGWILLALGLGSMVSGAAIMAKMVRFEI